MRTSSGAPKMARVVGGFLLLGVLSSCRYEASTSIDTETTEGWSEATPVKVPEITDEVVVKEGVLLDGQYWAMDAEVDASGDLIFSIARVRFGAVCEQWAKEQGRGDVGCLNDYAVDTTLSALVPARDALKVSVVSVSDQARRYDISEEAMVQLLAGDTSGSPRDFDFAPFPYVVTVLNGTVLTADQVWVP
ncbi:MAG: hypothetical protein ACKOFD_04110 [Actinomycetota bacterium]